MKDILSQCGDSLNRRKEKEHKHQLNERYEAEDLDDVNEEVEEEEEILSNLVDAIGQLLKLYGEEIMPIFDSLVAPAFSPYLSNKQPESLQVVAVCLLDDAIEFGGSAGHKYIEQLIPVLIQNTKSDNNILRQSSTFGIAKAIIVAPHIISRQLQHVVTALLELINSPEANEEDNEGTTENAIFGIGSICTIPIYKDIILAHNIIDRSQLINIWLRKLPLKADEQESKASTKQLCDIIESNDQVVMGENCSNFTEIVRIIAEVHKNNEIQSNNNNNKDDAVTLAHPETLTRMQNILKYFTSIDGAAKEQIQIAYQSLSPESQVTLNNILK